MNPDTQQNQPTAEDGSNPAPASLAIQPKTTESGKSPQSIPSSKRKLYMILTVIAVIFVLVVGGIAIGYHNHQRKLLSQAMVDIEQHNYEATVVIGNTGYTPATLTVKPDTEVFFENHTTNAEGENGTSRTVLQSKAAAIQDTGFHSGQILAQSGYGYVFRNSGTFQFYDADNPTLTVTIIVKN